MNEDLKILVEYWKQISEMHNELESKKSKSKYTLEEIQEMHERYGSMKLHIMNKYGYTNQEINDLVNKELQKK